MKKIALAVGTLAAGTVLAKGRKSSSGRPVVLIGKDTRISGQLIKIQKDTGRPPRRDHGGGRKRGGRWRD